MNGIYDELANRAIQLYESTQNSLVPNHNRVLIALAGAPGSGKTTIASHVATRINAFLGSSRAALVVSIDGFHLSRKVLDALSNREEAYIRRGAHWTFDAAAAVAFIRSARVSTNSMYAPTFDHALKDPVENGLEIPKETAIIIFEGNYLLCDLAPWSGIGATVDEKWFVNVDPELARRRVASRHVAAGIEPDLESAFRRVDSNDALNGKWINEHRIECDIVVESVDDVETSK